MPFGSVVHGEIPHGESCDVRLGSFFNLVLVDQVCIVDLGLDVIKSFGIPVGCRILCLEGWEILITVDVHEIDVEGIATPIGQDGARPYKISLE